MCSPLLGGFSGRKGRICESGRNKMKGQSDQTSLSLATHTPVFLVSNSAIQQRSVNFISSAINVQLSPHSFASKSRNRICSRLQSSTWKKCGEIFFFFSKPVYFFFYPSQSACRLCQSHGRSPEVQGFPPLPFAAIHCRQTTINNAVRKGKRQLCSTTLPKTLLCRCRNLL